MSTCAHCNRTFTCGCQKTTVDGIVVCKTCVTNYKQSKKNIAANIESQEVANEKKYS